MKPFNHNYFLGYVNEVTPQYIKIHFPSATLLSKFHHFGTNYAGGGVGNFVVIEGDEHGFLAQITEIKLSDSEKKELTEKAIEHKDSDFHPIGKAELLLSFNVYNPDKTQKTASKYPLIGAKVYSCSNEQIRSYVAEFGKKNEDENVYATLGKLATNDVECKVNLNSLFGRHCAIVGTTGGGKSWSVSKLIEEIKNETDNKVILIDTTGEYEKITSNSISFGEDVYFPHKKLNNSDFCFLFQENSPNTVSALCEAIHSLKMISLGKFQDGVKIGKDSSAVSENVRNNIQDFNNCDFDITQLSIQLKNECVKVGRNNLYEEDAFKLGYTSHLISRVNLFLQNNVVRSVFGIDNSSEKKEIVEVISEFLKGGEQILRIGFEKLSYDFSMREIVVDFISSFLLKEARKGSFKLSPVVFVIDEAHQFLNKRINAEDNTIFSLQSIDLIAKESRKYGLFLCLATQMPRDIPVGTLSQMGTFIVHRLINEKDKQAIENAASSANRNSLSFLPILGEGEALLVGVDFPMPLIVKINTPSTPPKSDTPRLGKKPITEDDK